MADRKPGQEPSMEEILTSIRQIIAEDQGGDERAATRRPPLGLAAAEADEVLELTEIVAEPEPRATPPLAAARASRTEPPAASRQEGAAMPPDAAESLISAETAKSSALSLARLTRTSNGDERKPASPASGATVEQFLSELLTPMLREWLDRHLPEIVERVVEQEVKKLARRAELL
jgi:cell pole-organizing protein PopZ